METDVDIDANEDKLWNGIATVAAVGAVIATRPIVERAWRMAFRTDPPGNPAHQDVAWRDALTWALLSGAMVGVIRLLAQRAAAAGWRRARGSYPKSLASTHS